MTRELLLQFNGLDDLLYDCQVLLFLQAARHNLQGHRRMSILIRSGICLKGKVIVFAERLFDGSRKVLPRVGWLHLAHGEDGCSVV